MLLVAQHGSQLFSGTQLQHGFALGLLQVTELALALLFDFQGLGACVSAFSMPFLPSSTHCFTSEALRSWVRLASGTVVLP